jgi:uncharacterized membrane protein
LTQCRPPWTITAVVETAVPEAPARTALSTMLAGGVLIVVAAVFLWFAPGSYLVYKALHVASAIVWVGGDVTLTTLGIVFERRRDGGALAELGKMGAWVGTRIYTPALFAVLAFGIALVEKGDLGWGAFWLDFALAGWAVAVVVGVGFVGPEFGRIDRAAQEHGPESAEVARRVKRLFTVFRFDTALLVLIAIDMTAKPFS